MVQVKALTDRSVAERFCEVKDEEGFWGDISAETRQLAKRILESTLDDELEARLQAGRYRRTEVRAGWRNGGYRRQVMSLWGVLDVWMPRARQALPPSRVLRRFQRRERQVDTLIRDAFLRGISTRQVGSVLEPVLGWQPSAQTVSRVVQSLDAAVRRFHWRQLDDDVCYLLLDGVTMKVKHPGGVATKLVLVAYGIAPEGRRRLLDFKLAKSESTAEWEAFLEDLFRRGLQGNRLRLIATDGGTGLTAAVGLVYPQVPRQRCWAHKLRNVAGMLRRKNQEACLRDAKRIYLADNRRLAGQRFRAWATTWRPIEPTAVRCLERDLPELFTFFAVPLADRCRVRTTNAIERCFREVRRRTRPMSCFQNGASCERIIYAVFEHLNRNWGSVPSPAFTQAS